MVIRALSGLVVDRRGLQGEAQAFILSPPSSVFRLVSDITRMGEWSPECRRCEWLDEDAGASVGARFRGYNQRGWLKWQMNCTVSAFEPDRVFAFEVSRPSGQPQTRWRYELEPTEGGSILTESFEVMWYNNIVTRLFYGGPQHRLAQLEDGVRQTLARIKVAAEIL